MQDYEEDGRYYYEPSNDEMEAPIPADDSNNENFKVAIRVRPPVPRELDGPRAFINVVRIPNDHKSITLCEHLDVDDGRGGVYSTQAFTFDHVYDPTTKQQQVYERSAQPAVQSVLKGYNATLIAYGQTGTGKTYTMEGFTNNENRGIIPRATEEIFSYINSLRNNRNVKFLVRASYLQIYNEVISDLLKPLNKQLSVRHTKQRGVYIDGLSEWVVRSPDDVYGLMERGCSLRATGSTKMSELSSRSHAMFMIIVEVMEGDESNPQSYKYGKLNIVDLAGSEKVRQTGVTGQRLEETKKINWSLHELGNVISALTDKRGKDKHIPFRNSQLTRVLQDSLGGNCKTTLIACISPALEAYSESLSTLKFANRAKNIKNDATINEDLDQGTLLRKYEKELQRLRAALQEKGGGAGYVDPSLLDELASGKRRVEEDHRAALQALEDTSRAMEVEQSNRKRLEDRINELEGMIGEGVGGPRAADEYAMRLDELDRERQVMEEDKAQVDRYKQLLLKQRDVMLNLTTRLNERDETILHLQEEIDAYDAHIQMLEDAMDANATSLSTRTDAESYLGRIRCRTDTGARYQSEGNPEHLLTAEEKIIELLMVKGRGQDNGGGAKGAMADDERRSMEIVLRDRLEAVAHKAVRSQVRGLQSEIERMSQRLEVSEGKRRAAESALASPDHDTLRRIIDQEQSTIRNQVTPRLNQALGDLSRERDRNAQLHRDVDTMQVELVQLKSLLDGARRQEVDRVRNAVLTLEESLVKGFALESPNGSPPGSFHDPTNMNGGGNAARVPQLESLVASLRKSNAEYAQLLTDKDSQARASLEAALQAKEREYSQMSRSLSTHIKDRKALKTILESRIKVKVEGICEGLAQQVDRQRILSDARALQNLVNASVAAMDSSDV